MKRNMDLIRQIAFESEQLEPRQLLNSINGVDAHEFSEHVELMIEVGLISGRAEHFLGGESPDTSVLRLTWSGHDFLDSVRNESLWNRAKELVIKPSAGWTFEILKEWLKTEIKNGLPTMRGLAN